MNQKKTILISGATAGIGRATALKFAQENYNLILTGRRSDRLERLKTDILMQYEVECETLCFDVRNKVEVLSALESLNSAWRMIDVLVNNAGLALGLSDLADGNLEDWDTMIDTNIKGMLYISRFVLPWMIANKKGHIINIGSIAAKEAYPKGNVYCSTKFAVDAITKSLRAELLPYGLKVSGIHPGAVETEFSVVRFKGDQQRADKVYDGFEPLEPENVADAIYYVASTPAHVCINDLVIMPLAQANAGVIYRNS